MRAVWYERPGDAIDVLQLGDLPRPEPAPNEVRVHIEVSGINPGDVKKRSDAFGIGMAYPRVVPHSDGAGVIDAVGTEVDDDWVGCRVWVFGAQSYRPFGTAAEFCCVPTTQAASLPDGVSFEQGAALGIPGITAHRCVFAAGPVANKTVLVQGGAGAVGTIAVHLAKRAGARVIATVRREDDQALARQAGADHVVTDFAQVPTFAPDGIDHAVEVDWARNAPKLIEILKVHGSVATYATSGAPDPLPFWPLVFKNITVSFLGSDDFRPEHKAEAARDLTAAAQGGWVGLPVGARFPLEGIAEAHECVEERRVQGRVMLIVR